MLFRVPKYLDDLLTGKTDYLDKLAGLKKAQKGSSPRSYTWMPISTREEGDGTLRFAATQW
jgi:hypothetical protein